MEQKLSSGRGRPVTVGHEKRKGIMLAYPFEEKRLIKWNTPYVIVQPKLDGERCRVICKMNEVTLLSSTEKKIVSVPHIDEELRSMYLFGEFDGELYTHGLNFNEISSRVGRTVNIHDTAGLINLNLFDLISDRMQQVDRITSLYNNTKLNKSSQIKLLPFNLARSMREIEDLIDKYTSDGYEGIIVRHPAAFYKRSRSTFMMKWKPKKRDRYLVTGVYEEIDIYGNPKNQLGGVNVISDDGVEFNVGSGFTNDERIYYWKHPEEIVGHYIIVEYQYINPNRKPMFGRYKSIIE